jgi:hypothetical protein
MLRSAAIVAGLLCSIGAHAAPIEVRMPEGYTHGFVRFFAGREMIASGELLQFPRGGEWENRLTVSFDDGSSYDETLTFTQARVFRLRKYHLIQRGPSFPEATGQVRRRGSYRASIERRRGGEGGPRSHPNPRRRVQRAHVRDAEEPRVRRIGHSARRVHAGAAPADAKLVPEGQDLSM